MKKNTTIEQIVTIDIDQKYIINIKERISEKISIINSENNRSEGFIFALEETPLQDIRDLINNEGILEGKFKFYNNSNDPIAFKQESKILFRDCLFTQDNKRCIKVQL